MKNYWVSNNSVDYATWTIQFYHLDISVETLKSFVAKLVDYSRKFQIAELKATPGLHGHIEDFHERSDYDYMDYVEEVVQKYELFPLFNTHHSTLSKNSIVSKICYYNDLGDVETKSIDNAGQILRQTRSEALSLTHSSKYMSDAPPIRLGCQFLPVKNGMIAENWFVLLVTLHSDIWFPHVYDLLDRGEALSKRIKYNQPYDNSELANCHTKRLNKFLASIRHETVKIGAEWSLDPDAPPIIKDMMTESGIILDE
ncbi:MAG: hypothetical protein AAF846_02210 [Chloroflexota bacterium]